MLNRLGKVGLGGVSLADHIISDVCVFVLKFMFDEIYEGRHKYANMPK